MRQQRRTGPGLTQGFSLAGAGCTDQNMIMLTDAATRNNISISGHSQLPRQWSHHGIIGEWEHTTCYPVYLWLSLSQHSIHSTLEIFSDTGIIFKRFQTARTRGHDSLRGWEILFGLAVSYFYDPKDNFCLLTVNFLPHLKCLRQLNKNQQ